MKWWHGRTLHARLALLVTGAVAVAVVAVAGLAFAAVAQIEHHQQESQLRTDARAIAAHPDRWQTAGAGRRDDEEDDDHHHNVGPRWQILDPAGAVVSTWGGDLPVTDQARQVAAGRRSPVQETVTVDGHRHLMLTVPATGGGAVQVALDQDPVEDTLALLAVLLVVGSVIGICVAALLGRAVARAGLMPVQQLTDAVEKVALTMDLDRPVPVRGADEIARLGRSVNTMLTAIGTARQAQRALVEDAGHELRTPLTSLRTNIELLLAVERQPDLAHRLPPEERTRLLDDLDAQVGELATLTAELVELSREETTREQLEPVELTDVVDAALERVRVRAPRIAFAADLDPVTVHGRPGELERMVLNVLDNAAKWSPPDATVHIGLQLDGPDHCRLTVTDTGPGIDAADRPHVFDRFYRAAAARGLPGSGLGLAIVAQTAHQHGGTVTATSHTPHGTVITIRLPRLI
ncbi:HAMP domain-containing sensor histidine kinase [Virgisporangium ochraceum]|uniref:histidine kinase n=1 Tax=Virgisporangium ochraceum TaxID=65505 RepID=A0A8J4EEF6_9ACTN|nr:HAMP domain-containing sensor histidine kinase [Virgisporangium ochraceum]GIJ71681.1 two-component sensor histidine kinase [Virgisporangium ochraceum]